MTSPQHHDHEACVASALAAAERICTLKKARLTPNRRRVLELIWSSHDVVGAYQGSISAEHGLGRLKTEEVRRYKSPLEIETMAAIRRALDPKRIMNPAVLF